MAVQVLKNEMFMCIENLMSNCELKLESNECKGSDLPSTSRTHLSRELCTFDT